MVCYLQRTAPVPINPYLCAIKAGSVARITSSSLYAAIQRVNAAETAGTLSLQSTLVSKSELLTGLRLMSWQPAFQDLGLEPLSPLMYELPKHGEKGNTWAFWQESIANWSDHLAFSVCQQGYPVARLLLFYAAPPRPRDTPISYAIFLTSHSESTAIQAVNRFAATAGLTPVMELFGARTWCQGGGLFGPEGLEAEKAGQQGLHSINPSFIVKGLFSFIAWLSKSVVDAISD